MLYREEIKEQNGKKVIGPVLTGSFLLDGFRVLVFESKYLLLSLLGRKSKIEQELE